MSDLVVTGGATGPRWAAGMAPLADLYDGFIVDQWGVLHDGSTAYAGVAECLEELVRRDKRVVVLSNSGKRADHNARNMARLGLPPRLYTAIVTSGEATWIELKGRIHPFTAGLGRRCLVIARDDDLSVADGLDLDIVDDVADADFILLSGVDGRALDGWKPLLIAARQRSLPMICGNPDVLGLDARGTFPGAGSVARLYREMGGAVRFIGKPHPEIYEYCWQALGPMARERVVAVGDSIGHDGSGGAAAGAATALVAGGVHADAFADLDDDDSITRRAAALGAEEGAMPDWVLPAFVW